MTKTGVLFFLLLTLTLVVYWFGLKGPFLFDDFANLPALADFGGIRDFQSLRLFLLNGIAGPTGRPLSLLSFLIDDNAWPSDPWHFKYTNLMFHLLNGCLLSWLTFRIFKFRGRSDAAAGWIALFIGSFWLLHPLNVSTVLYVVQRMAMLSTLFVLTGLLVYVRGRTLLAEARPSAYLWMTAGIGFTVLATLSKENGALLPVLALALEYTVLSSADKRPNTMWQSILLWLPTGAITVYLFWEGITGRGFGGRSFTVSERLLTECRVLLDYLFHWFMPFAPTRGLFAEDYPISTGLFSPPTTLLALTTLAAAFIGAVWKRDAHPTVALGILFFLGGHLIESTSVPLEIYFEHRNYLPAMFLFLPIAEYGVENARKVRLLPVFLGVLVLGMAFTTHRLVRIWSDEARLALYRAEQNPFSGRAQGAAASALDRLGYSQAALNILTRAIERQPTDIHLHLHYLVQACYSASLHPEDFERALEKFRRTKFNFRSYPLFESMMETLPNGDCTELGFEQLHALLDAFERNPGASDSGARRQIHHLRGLLYARQKAGDSAFKEFRESLRLRPDISAGLLEVSILATHGLYAEALQLLDSVRTLPNSGNNLYKRWATLDYPAEIERLQRVIEEDMRHFQAP
ncbi:tetratricopeptide repeat protein [Methylocaldum szegediense]|uniref:Protein O-mannosyl-transferase n=1 Tax=Methylocaldum szegediense TaxID=73780 RepID=A0ABN8X5J1_9GAMM|nr:hypothetical protein [Methylocaldum szegediense]CAI8832807.1 protein O-mannosyl-transferase [Methylocaldum szegediense]